MGREVHRKIRHKNRTSRSYQLWAKEVTLFKQDGPRGMIIALPCSTKAEEVMNAVTATLKMSNQKWARVGICAPQSYRGQEHYVHRHILIICVLHTYARPSQVRPSCAQTDKLYMIKYVITAHGTQIAAYLLSTWIHTLCNPEGLCTQDP